LNRLQVACCDENVYNADRSSTQRQLLRSAASKILWLNRITGVENE
jgi:hypothetical protein